MSAENRSRNRMLAKREFDKYREDFLSSFIFSAWNERDFVLAKRAQKIIEGEI